jgi:hypothetical protein
MPRPKGAKNKRTLLREQLIQAIATTSPLEFLLGIVRSDNALVDLKTKIDAAKACLPYCHVRKGEPVSARDMKLVEGYGPDNPDPLLIPRSIPTRRDS